MRRGPFRPAAPLTNRSAQAGPEMDGETQFTSEPSSQASRRPSTATASARAAANSTGNADPRELSQLPPPSYESALTYNGAFALPRLRQRHLRPKSRTAETQTDIPLETTSKQTAVSGASRPYHSTLRPIVGFHEISSSMSTVGTQTTILRKQRALSPTRRPATYVTREHVLPRVDTGLEHVHLRQRNATLSSVEEAAAITSVSFFSHPTASPVEVDVPQIVSSRNTTDAKFVSVGTSPNGLVSDNSVLPNNSATAHDVLVEANERVASRESASDESMQPAAVFRQRSLSEPRPRNPVALTCVWANDFTSATDARDEEHDKRATRRCSAGATQEKGGNQ